MVAREVDDATLAKGIGKIEKQLARAVEKGKLEQSAADEIRGRIEATTGFDGFEDCDLVIEAITENLGAEARAVEGARRDREGRRRLRHQHVVAVGDRPGRVDRAARRFIGLHFFNPAQVMPLLEVVQTVTTDEDALKTGFEFGEKCGKLTVHAKDKTGFIVNRLLVPYMLDAIRAYEEGVGSVDQIDAAMKGGAAHPMGPFTLLDFVGLDTTKSIADIMFDEYRERRFAAPPTLRKMVAAGFYGRKSGKGFYDYSGEKPVVTELGL